MLFRCIIAVVAAWVNNDVPLLGRPAADGDGYYLGVLGVEEGPCNDTETGCICGLSVWACLVGVV